MRSHWYYTTNERYLTYLKSKEWLVRRQQVIQRCNNTCERCGKFQVAEVHHLTYARIFNEELADLQGLCEYCHAFVHGERTDDGAAEYERLAKRPEELRQRVGRARFELQRFEEKPEVYQSFISARFSSHRELIALLRQYPRLIRGGFECQIFDIRYAKRKHESAVTFKVKWETQGGFAWSVVKSAEQLLHSGVLDIERGLWVEMENIRLFVKGKSKEPA